MQSTRTARRPLFDSTHRRFGGIATAAVMAVILLFSVTGALAIADEAEEQTATFLPSDVDSAEDLAPLIAGSEAVDLRADTDPSVAEELPRTDLSRGEAEALLEGVFGMEEVEASAKFFDELEIEAFRSDHVAVISPPVIGGQPGLLSSTLPLRTADESGEDAPVDLGLEASGGSLEPANSLVEVQIPTQLSEGISLPDAGVTVELAGGEVDRSASELGDASAFYPNVATDTDLVVSAVPTGFETYTHLRSPEAPTRQRFTLDVPAGAELRENDPGGAEVVRADGSVALSVSVPSAIDAEGSAVPVEIEVDGSSIILSVDPRLDAAYPILVDPVFDTYNFTTATSPGVAGKDWIGGYSGKQFGASWGSPNYGMNVQAVAGPTVAGSNAWFNYYVPRYWTDLQAGIPPPTTYIREMKLWNLTYMMPDETGLATQYRAAYPSLQVGLWSANKGEFVAWGERFGHEGQWIDANYVFPLENYPAENTDVKNGGFGIATWSSYNTVNRYVNVQQASVEVTDQDSPGFGSISNPSGWMNATSTGKIGYVVSEPGLGIYSLQVKQPKAEGGSQVITTTNNCVGSSQSPCPRKAESATRAITYNPQSMAQGENFVEVTAADPVNHISSPAFAKIKVDHSAPAISLSGSLTEQATAGVNLPAYTLNYEVSDGDDAAAAAQSPIGTQGTGPGQLERPSGVAVDAGGNVWAVDRTNKKIVKYDKNGNFASQFGVAGTADGQLGDLRGIAIAPNGNLWVTQAGTKGVQQFTPAGAYVSKITNSEFSGVYGIAVANGVVWLADQTSGNLYQYKEDGALIRVMKGGGGKIFGVPTAIDTDKFGNAWVTSQGLNQVLQVSPTGSHLFSFGSSGTGNGQFQNPQGIAVAESGNLLVVDGPGRVQVFKPDGTFLRSFGVGGVNGQFNEPREIAVGAGNMAYIADAGNHRIARWAHADEDPQSGAAKLEIKVDGVTAMTKAPGCTTKNCAITGSWTLDADDYSGGVHKVEVIATDAVGIQATKTIDVETHGDGTNPTIALSGTMTQQASLGTTRPSYKLKAVASDPGPAAETKSGVASTTIKVDGALVDWSAPGCPAGGCSITREWTLNSNSFSAGPHTVEVKATDAVGRSTTKTLAIEIARDTTAPEFSFLSGFYTAPSGWVEQKSYDHSVIAKDPNGYGVTSVQLKIDGKAVDSFSQSCPAGACLGSIGFGKWLDMEGYDGGAHPAELIATDGAGNWKKKTWMINVVPSGNVSRTEAVATMEASDETSGANTIGAAEENAEVLPMSGDVFFEGESEGFTAPEAAAPLLVRSSPDQGMTIRVPMDEVTEEVCPLAEQEMVEEEPSEPVPQVEFLEPCELDESYGDEFIDRVPVTVTPSQTSPSATELGLDASAAVAVSANIQGNVDQLIRPLYNGTQSFMAIRDSAAPIEYSWRVQMEEDQTLALIDAQHAVVRWESGHTALTITANKAHDAIGTELPTTISVAGDTLTLHVPHRSPSPAGGNYVYPVTAGAGWQGGFQTYEVKMPPPTEIQDEEAMPPEGVEYWENGDEIRVRVFSLSAPELFGRTEDGEDKFHYKFRFSDCKHTRVGKSPVPKPRREMLMAVVGACVEQAAPVRVGMTVHGWLNMIPGKWIWVNEDPRQIHCKSYGDAPAAVVNCFARPWKAKHGITLRGDFRLSPKSAGYYHVAECWTLYAEVFSVKPYMNVRESITSQVGADDYFEPCNWPG